MMSDFLRTKIIRKHKADFRAIEALSKMGSPISIETLKDKFAFSPSRAASAIQNAYLCGVLSPDPKSFPQQQQDPDTFVPTTSPAP